MDPSSPYSGEFLWEDFAELRSIPPRSRDSGDCFMDAQPQLILRSSFKFQNTQMMFTDDGRSLLLEMKI